MKIIDCFTFFNEIDLLLFRCKELNDVVDYFVLVEANRNFSNLDKPFYFEDNKNLFQEYIHKFVHIKVEDMPSGPDAWAREKHQRNCINRGLLLIQPENNDVVVISDLDEIPDSDSLQQ